MELNYQRLQHQITGMDEAYIAGYNKYKGIGHQYLIHTKIKPCPFEGDLEQVVVLILLANPMYSHSSSSETDHVISNLQRGWGIFSLAPSSNEGIRNWWVQHLAALQKHTGLSWRELSNKVAAVQVHTWASSRFDECFKPPSLSLSQEIAIAFARRARLIICGRRRTYWQHVMRDPSLAAKMVYLKSVRRPYVSPGNLPPGAFANVCTELGAPIGQDSEKATTRLEPQARV